MSATVYVYNRHPYQAPRVRKQHPRKVQWRTKAEPFDPAKVTRL